MKKIILFVIINFLLSGCATLLTGTRTKVNIVALNVPDAKVYSNGKLVGEGSCVVESKGYKIKKTTIEIKKDGYVTQTFHLKAKIKPVFFLNILSVTTGFFVDIATGAFLKASPSTIEYNLVKSQEIIKTSDIPVAISKNKSSSEKTSDRSSNEEEKDIYASNIDYTNPGKYYAIIIGVSNYIDPNIPDLDSLPILDAISLKNSLNKNYLFEKENILELYNPTRRDIVTAFADMSKKISSNDNLLIFYGGHGHYEKENDIGYWLPSDAEVSNPSNWLYNDQLVADVKKIKSLHTLLISDACFSGSIFKTRSVNMEEASNFVKQKYQLTSRKAITSGTLKTVPNKSVFIKYLLDRLNNNNEKFFSTSQLFQSIEQPVSNNSKSLPQFGVIQNVGDEGGDFIFIKR